MDGKPDNVNPSSLTVEQAAQLLTKVMRQQIPPSLIGQDVMAGAPTNADGTINLLHYAAWLVKEMGRGD